jgi:hypothetical protein
MLAPNAVTLRMTDAGRDGRPLGQGAPSKDTQRRGNMAYPEPGSGPLFAYAPAPKSGGMKIRQAPQRATGATASASKGLMGYAPE